MKMLHDHDGISILHIVEMLDLGSGHFSHDSHLCAFDNGGRIEKFRLQRKKPPLGLLAIDAWPLLHVQRQLQELNLRSSLEPFGFQHISTKYHKSPRI